MALRRFWPVGEAAQADYEALRVAAARFARRGLAGLIAWPAAEPMFVATLVGATRPAWVPHHDPREEALAAGFSLLLAAPVPPTRLQEAQR